MINEHINNVSVIGEVCSDVSISHYTHGKDVYGFKIKINRLNKGVSDIINVKFEKSEKIDEISIGDTVEISGEFHSYNNKYDEVRNGKKATILMFIYAKQIEKIDKGSEHKNSIHIIGNICKKPNLRHTYSNIAICDSIVAVNRKYGKSDYIPCISWGKNAEFNSDIKVGSKIDIEGRIQSREYIKIENNKETQKIAYEVSIYSISIIE